ncbi:MAG: alginate lyase family protein [Spirochaetes bacterium]|nr:alginate lyase family protein [Spirochaetota bacterium]
MNLEGDSEIGATREAAELLLSRMDFALPSLESAEASRQDASVERVADRIVDHFRRRTSPVYLFGEADLGLFTDKEIVKEANEICNHLLLGHTFSGEIDWRFNATDTSTRDSEWTWSLSRHSFWIPLARAYRMTGDEKYAREFVCQLKSFVTAWPVAPHMPNLVANMEYPGDAWRSIEAAIRIYTSWLPAMQYFWSSPSWDVDGWVCFLNSVHDHAEFLFSHYSNHTRCSNWSAMEATALFQLGVMFPEFKRAREWQNLGYRRVCQEARYQFDHYGIHIERTPVYQLVVVLSFLQAYRIAMGNGIPVPPYLLPILTKSAEFLGRIVKPDFSLPMIGDADRISLLDRKADKSKFEGMNLTTDPIDLNEIRAFFRTMTELTRRKDFLYFASGRECGSPPSKRCYAMPDAGFYVFRTGWSRHDSYFLVTGTQVERGSNAAHSHSDAGHLEINLEGEDVLIDSGRYLYGNCGHLDWWQYFASTCAHNTVDVDGWHMGTVPNVPPEVRGVRTYCHLFKESRDMCLVDISHNGFAFLAEPVFHRRRVIFLNPALWLVDDVLTGLGTHEYSQCFNFAPGTLTVKPNSIECIFSRNAARVDILPLDTNNLSMKVLEGSTDPKGGWVSYAYSERIPAPQVIYRKEGTLPVRFVTAILRHGAASIRVERHEDADDMELYITSRVRGERPGLKYTQPQGRQSKRHDLQRRASQANEWAIRLYSGQLQVRRVG